MMLCELVTLLGRYWDQEKPLGESFILMPEVPVSVADITINLELLCPTATPEEKDKRQRDLEALGFRVERLIPEEWPHEPF